MCNTPKFPLSYRFFQPTIKISQLPTSSMHQVCYNFWIKGSQLELMSTLGVCPFSLLKTSLAALICADGRNFFTPVCHNVWSKARLLPRAGPWRQSIAGEMPPPWWAALWEGQGHFPCLQAALQPFWGHMLSTAGDQTAGICQELHLAHGVEKERGCSGMQLKCGRICTYT